MRLVIERVSEGSVQPASDELQEVAPPALHGIRLVYGVGSSPDAVPEADDFHPVYTVSMPIFSSGGLDPNGIYEFDAGAQLQILQSRATQRLWAMRLELELFQSSEAITAAELWIDTPWKRDEGPRATLLEAEAGERRPGGGRVLVLASTPVTTPAAARELGGRFTTQLRDADPRSSDSATVESAVFEIHCDLHGYEFEAQSGPKD